MRAALRVPLAVTRLTVYRQASSSDAVVIWPTVAGRKSGNWRAFGPSYSKSVRSILKSFSRTHFIILKFDFILFLVPVYSVIKSYLRATDVMLEQKFMKKTKILNDFIFDPIYI